MYRGLYKQKSPNGTPITYMIGDKILYQGKVYVALNQTQKNPIQSPKDWKFTNITETYQGTTPPLKPVATQSWVSDDVVGYVYFQDENGGQWVQPGFKGGGSTSISILATKFVTGSSYQATNTDYYIGVSYAGPVQITLPSFPETGREIVIKDESGNAGDGINRQITITGYSAVDTIDNKISATINLDNAGLHFIYRSGWRII